MCKPYRHAIIIKGSAQINYLHLSIPVIDNKLGQAHHLQLYVNV